MIFKQGLSDEDRQLNSCKGVEGAVKLIMVDVLQHCLGKQVRQDPSTLCRHNKYKLQLYNSKSSLFFLPRPVNV